MSNISGIGRSDVQVQSLLTIRNQLDDLQTQLGSGLKSTTYAGLGLDRGLAVGLNTQLSAISSFSNTISTVSTRLQIAQTALTAVDKSASAVKTSTINSAYKIDQTGQTPDQKSASSQFDQILNTLNTRVGDNYIFSGRSPDKPSVESADQILNGDGTKDGFKTVLTQRNQADLGANGLGRLAVTSPSTTSVNLAEDAVSPFGFKLASVASTLTGVTTPTISGTPPSVTVDLGATNPSAGDALTFNFNLPDGTTASLKLTATTASPPPAGGFTIGADTTATAANLGAALTASLGTLAGTQLAAASSIAASNDFFNVDDAHTPQRVSGNPYTATALVDGSANTVTWYTGEAGSDPARSTASARIDSSISASYGIRANEQALRLVVQNVAVFAASSFSTSDVNGKGKYDAITQRLAASLDGPQGTQKVSDVEAEIAGAQTAIKNASDRHKQTTAQLSNLLDNVQSADQTEVSAKILTLQTSLQASLQVTAMLSKLSLVNFV